MIPVYGILGPINSSVEKVTAIDIRRHLDHRNLPIDARFSTTKPNGKPDFDAGCFKVFSWTKLDSEGLWKTILDSFEPE